MLADRVEQLRKELAETEAEVARPEAAKVVIGQFIEAERAGEADDPAMDAEPSAWEARVIKVKKSC
ncbi:hypothetical protein ACWFR5_21325 [Streptomyces sp. NPDC055092]